MKGLPRQNSSLKRHLGSPVSPQRSTTVGPVTSSGKVSPMDPMALAFVALIYVCVQGAVLLRFSGAWRIAAVFPVPALCVLLILSVIGGLFGVNGSEIASIIAVPLGLAYLILLMSAAQLARLFRIADA